MQQEYSANSKLNRILLVENEHLLSWSIAQALQKEGIDAIIAASGEEALNSLLNESFDIVITDLELPGIDGAVVARRAKQVRPQLPVIMISAEEELRTRDLTASHTIDHFVEIPFDMDYIARLVKECLGETSHANTL